MAGKGKDGPLRETRGGGDDQERGLAVVQYSGGLGIREFAPRDKATVARERSSSADSPMPQKSDIEEKGRTPVDRELDRVGKSEVTEAELKLLHEEGIIRNGWWLLRSEERWISRKHVGTLMALHSWFDAGLCVPIHPFIVTLMRTYGFDLVHLHPRSILRLNIFRWMCETVLHEPPSLSVFHYFFEVVIRPGKIHNVFGSAVVRFRVKDNNGDP